MLDGPARRAALDRLFADVAVLPVLVIEREADAVPLARALVAGGLNVLEVTLRTPAALACIRRIVGEIDGVVVGAGTVLSPRDMDAAAEAGALFAVSPGLNDTLAQVDAGLPLLPGIATPSEAMRAADAGFGLLKFFPAVPAGGTAMLSAMAGPLASLRFCPTGGLDAAIAADFLRLKTVACVGGSWMAPKSAIDAGTWDLITALARAAARLRRAA